MKCVIWYHSPDEEKVSQFIHKIIKNYKDCGKQSLVYAQGGRGYGRYISFGTNDNPEEDQWCIMPDVMDLKYLNEHNYKGWNIAFIDANISDKFKNNVIFPMLRLPPFQAYNYY